MVREIIQIGDDRLNTPSEPIQDSEINTKEFKTLLKDLTDTVTSKGNKAAGLSAVQIGVLKRVCICRRVDLEDHETEESKGLWEIMINPEFEVLDDEESIVWEGCLSIGKGEGQLWGPVARPSVIKAKFTTPEGHKKTVDATGFLSHIIQHEIDHLNGVLFLQYVQNPKNIWKNNELNDYLNKFGEFPDPID